MWKPRCNQSGYLDATWSSRGQSGSRREDQNNHPLVILPIYYMTPVHVFAGWFIKRKQHDSKMVYAEKMGRLASGVATICPTWSSLMVLLHGPIPTWSPKSFHFGALSLSLYARVLRKLQTNSPGFLAQFKARRTTYLVMCNVHHTQVTLEACVTIGGRCNLNTFFQMAVLKLVVQEPHYWCRCFLKVHIVPIKSRMTYLLVKILRPKTPQFQWFL